MARLSALASVALVAYMIRGASGIGSALLLVPLGALAVGALSAIVLSAFLDLASGAVLLGLDRQRRIDTDWRVYGVAMGLGVLVGSLGLRSIPVGVIGKVLGTITLLAAIWFLAGRPGIRVGGEGEGPAAGKRMGLGVCLVAGILGGISGMSGPPLAIYFGSRMEKGAFRSVVTRLFMVEAALRVVLYFATGLVNASLLPLLAVSIPAILLGTFAGNHVFLRLPERGFTALVGLVLLAAGLSLIL